MSKRKLEDITLDVSLRDENKIQLFSTLLMKLKLLNDNILLRWRTEGLRITMPDRTHQGVVLAFIPSGWFDSFSILLETGATQASTHLRTGVLKNALSVLNQSHGTLRLTKEGHDGNILTMEFYSKAGGTIDKIFRLPLMELDDEAGSIVFCDSFNEGPSEVDFQVSSARWADDMKDMKLFGSTVRLFCSEDAVTLTTQSEDTCEYTSTLGVDSIAIVEGTTHEESFGLRIMIDLCAFINLSSNLVVELPLDNPLRLVFPMDEGLLFVCHVAPRVKDNY